MIILKEEKNMAKIDHVDYEAMPRQAKAMREYALELNNELIVADIYDLGEENIKYGKVNYPWLIDKLLRC